MGEREVVGPEDLPWDTSGWWLHKRTHRWHRTVSSLFGVGLAETACGLVIPADEVQDYRSTRGHLMGRIYKIVRAVLAFVGLAVVAGVVAEFRPQRGLSGKRW
jgi:hypothetical protein